jgi:hypothetical protein
MCQIIFIDKKREGGPFYFVWKVIVDIPFSGKLSPILLQIWMRIDESFKYLKNKK